VAEAKRAQLEAYDAANQGLGMVKEKPVEKDLRVVGIFCRNKGTQKRFRSRVYRGLFARRCQILNPAPSWEWNEPRWFAIVRHGRSPRAPSIARPRLTGNAQRLNWVSTVPQHVVIFVSDSV